LKSEYVQNKKIPNKMRVDTTERENVQATYLLTYLLTLFTYLGNLMTI